MIIFECLCRDCSWDFYDFMMFIEVSRNVHEILMGFYGISWDITSNQGISRARKRDFIEFVGI